MARKKGHKDTDRYDIKEIKFHEKARRGYKELGRMLPRIWKQIDASQSVDRVHSETLNLFKKCKIG
jgi:dTMP kinase